MSISLNKPWALCRHPGLQRVNMIRLPLALPGRSHPIVSADLVVPLGESQFNLVVSYFKAACDDACPTSAALCFGYFRNYRSRNAMHKIMLTIHDSVIARVNVV